MKESIRIKSADSNEVTILIQKWIEKCGWLNEQGLATWNIATLTKESLQKQYLDPRYFVCYLNDRFLGGFILLTQDDFFWPEKKENDSYYIHKLLVCNDFTGKGYGTLILNWIKEFGKENNKKFLRLDYYKSKEKLRRFYEENGFYAVEEKQYRDNDINILAEYRI